MSKSLVTIIIICYNHQDYVEESIRSVLKQTYKNIELIIIDDYSTDNSIPVIEKLALENGIIFIKNPVNEGLNNSILTGINLSKGEYISILASDDIITLEKIEEQVNFLSKTQYDGVYSNGYTLQNGKQNLIKLNKNFNNYHQDNALKYLYRYDWGAPLLQSALFKKDVMVNLIEVRKEFKSDDWAFYIKALEEFRIGFINKPLFFYRLHNTNSHKMYWKTFPMRIDVAARLVPAKYRTRTISNIFLSQSQYLAADKKHLQAIKFFICSLTLSFSFYKIFSFGKSFLSSLKRKRTM